MRYGFTTGSCAAAAAKAAAYMLLTGKRKTEITIETPKGIPYTAQLIDIVRSEKEVSCAVEKDGGDDPDITTGALIYAKVSFGKESAVDKQDCPQILIDGGIGVGRVTKPGLDQPVGNAAINHVPREMITKEVLQVCKILDYRGALEIEISVPGGERLAEQTFNPRLGIVGGISILGTSGIVEPMSNQAILDTIKVELNQRKEQGFGYVAVSPGNYGLDFMKKTYGYDLDKSVKCSNFIGDTIDMAMELGFRKMLLTGHIGKLIKVSGGIMNTHSKEGDCRMELIAASAVKCGVEVKYLNQILECVTTEEAVRILAECGKRREVMDHAMERICYYLNKRARGKMQIDCIMYANEFGELGRSKEAAEWFSLLEQEQEQQI
ncbi:MAG: cobalamin biosynthesis protein CbiD [Lachnospiraceae bacterium]|nr:cobalamin biosynthesis protein CbiD [Lachnospiraceae bacterium]